MSKNKRRNAALTEAETLAGIQAEQNEIDSPSMFDEISDEVETNGIVFEQLPSAEPQYSDSFIMFNDIPSHDEIEIMPAPQNETVSFIDSMMKEAELFPNDDNFDYDAAYEQRQSQKDEIALMIESVKQQYGSIADEYIQAGYNYGEVAKLEDLVEKIGELKQKSVENIGVIGAYLINVRDSINHGDWSYFVEKRAKLNMRSAQNYMNCARAINRFPALLNGTVDLAAIYYIGQKDLSDEVVEQILMLPSADLQEVKDLAKSMPNESDESDSENSKPKKSKPELPNMDIRGIDHINKIIQDAAYSVNAALAQYCKAANNSNITIGTIYNSDFVKQFIKTVAKEDNDYTSLAMNLLSGLAMVQRQNDELWQRENGEDENEAE